MRGLSDPGGRPHPCCRLRHVDDRPCSESTRVPGRWLTKRPGCPGGKTLKEDGQGVGIRRVQATKWFQVEGRQRAASLFKELHVGSHSRRDDQEPFRNPPSWQQEGGNSAIGSARQACGPREGRGLGLEGGGPGRPRNADVVVGWRDLEGTRLNNKGDDGMMHVLRGEL